MMTKHSNHSFVYITLPDKMAQFKFNTWEDFIENNKNKEYLNKKVKDISQAFFDRAPDHA